MGVIVASCPTIPAELKRHDYNCGQVALWRKKTGKHRLSRPGWCEVVAIGASAGGLLALGELLGNLDAEFPPILIVQHLDPRHKSQLARLLARKTRKSIKEAEDGEPI